MTRPALARFLDGPTAQGAEDSHSDRTGAEVAELKRRLGGVLAAAVTEAGPEAVTRATGLEGGVVEEIGALPDGGTEALDGLSLRTVAAILATASSFQPDAVRGRIRDHLLVQMSRGPVDVETVADRYGFGDPETLRAKIEGEEPISVREYARLRVALRVTD